MYWTNISVVYDEDFIKVGKSILLLLEDKIQ